MATLKTATTLQVDITLTINEREARALCELASFSADDVQKVLYTVSPAMAREHEHGFNSLLQTLRPVLNRELGHLDQARQFLKAKS